MDNLYSKIESCFSKINHPSRYIGSEFCTKSINYKVNDYNFCMVYPDIYDVGQSNQAVNILCNRVNEQVGLCAQRSFLPDVDALNVFRNNDIPMFSLERFAPLYQFDSIGITVSHELVATNVLEVLDFANIPVKTKDRNDNDPLVFGGGPISCNPEPFWEFFDVITIGEGEISTIEALKLHNILKKQGLNRTDILHELAKLDGIYVPSLYEFQDKTLSPIFDDVPSVIKRSIYKDFSKSNAFEDCFIPYVEIIHDRLNVEILRGCSRGCRFCQAGVMYRPVRERSNKNICNAAKIGIEKTGHDEVSLTSLSSTDHSQISDILSNLNDEFQDLGIRISIPSQRLDSFGVDMAKLVAGNKRGGLTFAIEAGSQRLRDVINKNVTEKNIFDAVDLAFKNGWNRAKLYFMIGLPTETDNDLLEIARLCEDVLSCARNSAGDKRKHGINISVSCAIFVPKAQTPFMFDGQISIDEAKRRIGLIRNNIKSKAISFSWHSPESSQIEAVLARGSRQCSSLIYNA